MTANITKVTDKDRIKNDTFAYQWKCNDTSIVGNSTEVNYILTQEEVGCNITVQVNYTDAYGTNETLVSDARGPVINVNDDPAGRNSIFLLQLELKIKL